MERTVRKIAGPGKMGQWGAKSRLSLASNRSRPQVGISGGKPRPRNESVDSAMIAAATSSEPATITGPIELGRMCRTTCLSGGAPRLRAASTNSFSRSDRNWARTTRPTGREREAPAVEHPREEVLAEVVGPERVAPRRALELLRKVDLVDRQPPGERARDDGADQHEQDRGADHRQAVAPEAADGFAPEQGARGGERDGELLDGSRRHVSVTGTRSSDRASRRAGPPRGSRP